MAFPSKIHQLYKSKLWVNAHSIYFRFLFSLIILIAMVYPATNSVAAATLSDQSVNENFAWTPQSVDTPMLFNYMGDRSLRMDTANHPHIAFGGDHLYYAYHDGLNWNFETVDPSDGVGLFASLALDSSKQPHISHYETIQGALKYAYYDGADWVITTLDKYALSAEDDINTPDTVLGTSNRYVGERQWRSFPTGLPGDSIDPNAISPISDLIGYGLYNSIAIDAAGNLHISYYDSVNGNIKYAHTPNGSWSISTVDFNGDVGSYSSLAVNSSGFPQISYYDKTNGNLKYASFNGTTWILQNLDTSGDTGLFTSIALGQNQRPAISYYDNTNEYLRYGYYNGSNWTYQTVDPDAKVGQYTSLAMTIGHQPRISYFDGDEANLRYASWMGGYWKIETISSNGYIGLHTSLALDTLDKPRISYFDACEGDLDFASF